MENMAEPQSLFHINKQSNTPLYDLIEQNFRDLITSGQLKPGEAVPSEWDLASLYGVSRLTLRHALDNLVRQDWLFRKHGVGTFVANPRIARIAPSKLSFTEQMLAIGRVPSSRQISIQIIPSSPEVAQRLKLQENEPVIEITRLRLADNEPILLETAYLSQNLFPGITPQSDFSNVSLYETMSTQYQATVATMDQTLEPVLLSEEDAAQLDTQPGAPALLSETISFTADGTPVEYSWSVTRGDQCKFYFHFQRGDNSL
jgi:GntR family transcriptional regulator